MGTPATLPGWWMAACRKRFGLSSTRPARMPKPAPKWALNEWAKFEVWDRWLTEGKKTHRPVELTGWTPGHWAWVIHHELMLKRKQKPRPHPVPPPPAKLYTVPAVFQQKGLLSTWAPENGTPDPVALAAQAKRAGCWVAFQWNPENLGRLGEYVDACRAAGVTVGLWEQINNTLRPASEVHTSIDRYRAAFFIACIEGDWGRFDPTELRDIAGPSYPLAVLTTWVGMNDAARNKPWILAGYTCMTEAYTNQDPNVTPGTGDRMAYWRGWPAWKILDPAKPLEEGCLHTVPCVGLYWGADFGLYQEALKPWGTAFNCYTVETMTDQNLQDVAGV